MNVSRNLKRRGFKVRINTNGHAPLIHGPRVVHLLKDTIDEVSVSLNAQDEKNYIALSRPAAGAEAYEAMLEFSTHCVKALDRVSLSIVTLSPGEMDRLGIVLDPDACRTIAEKMGASFRMR